MAEGRLSGRRFACLGDSITSDQVTGIGTLVAQKLGMTLVGWGSVLLGGCPLRQLILAGEGNTDSAVAVLGMFVGAAFCHNFKLASSGAGTTPNGRIACILMLVVMLVIAVYNTKKSKA